MDGQVYKSYLNYRKNSERLIVNKFNKIKS